MKIEVECAFCKTKFESKPSAQKNSKSGLRFCDRTCKDKAQRIGGIREIMPPHYGASLGRAKTRRIIQEMDNPIL